MDGDDPFQFSGGGKHDNQRAGVRPLRHSRWERGGDGANLRHRAGGDQNEGIPVFLVNMNEYMEQTDTKRNINFASYHNKTMILGQTDGSPVVTTGSYNFTYPALMSNSEDISFIQGAEYAYYATGAIRMMLKDDPELIRISQEIYDKLSQSESESNKEEFYRYKIRELLKYLKSIGPSVEFYLPQNDKKRMLTLIVDTLNCARSASSL